MVEEPIRKKKGIKHFSALFFGSIGIVFALLTLILIFEANLTYGLFTYGGIALMILLVAMLEVAAVIFWYEDTKKDYMTDEEGSGRPVEETPRKTNPIRYQLVFLLIIWSMIFVLLLEFSLISKMAWHSSKLEGLYFDRFGRTVDRRLKEVLR